mgnify:CR=1 FL=1
MCCLLVVGWCLRLARHEHARAHATTAAHELTALAGGRAAASRCIADGRTVRVGARGGWSVDGAGGARSEARRDRSDGRWARAGGRARRATRDERRATNDERATRGRARASEAHSAGGGRRLAAGGRCGAAAALAAADQWPGEPARGGGGVLAVPSCSCARQRETSRRRRRAGRHGRTTKRHATSERSRRRVRSGRRERSGGRVVGRDARASRAAAPANTHARRTAVRETASADSVSAVAGGVRAVGPAPSPRLAWRARARRCRLFDAAHEQTAPRTARRSRVRWATSRRRRVAGVRACADEVNAADGRRAGRDACAGHGRRPSRTTATAAHASRPSECGCAECGSLWSAVLSPRRAPTQNTLARGARPRRPTIARRRRGRNRSNVARAIESSVCWFCVLCLLSRSAAGARQASASLAGSCVVGGCSGNEQQNTRTEKWTLSTNQRG